MKRRFSWLALTVFLAVSAALAGCEAIHRNVRPAKDHDPDVAHASGEAVESDGNKILDVQSDGKKSKPFFRASRLSGGLSSEAREIEDSLGIH